MKLENERLLVEIAELGAEVTRIYDKEKNTEVLWEGNPTYWKRHSPILFPNVGKTYKNTVLIDGVQYPTSQHGFARDSVFECICYAKEKASFLFVSNGETKEVYPFDFELIVTYVLEENKLRVKWEVKNPADETMYFTIGGHPAFRFAEKEEKKNDYMLKFPGKDSLKYILIDPVESAADISKEYDLELKENGCQISEEMFKNDALIFDNGQFDEVWICHKDGTPYVGMECKGFPDFGIWSMKDAPFVCLEPWDGRVDNVGFDKELSEKPDVVKLVGKGKYEKEYTIIVG